MPRPRNPDRDYTVKIPGSLVPFLQKRAAELGLSMPQYVAALVRNDFPNLGKPMIVPLVESPYG